VGEKKQKRGIKMDGNIKIMQGNNGGVYLVVDEKNCVILSKEQVEALKLQTRIEDFDMVSYRLWYGERY
jgi:hypothetical protein